MNYLFHKHKKLNAFILLFSIFLIGFSLILDNNLGDKVFGNGDGILLGKSQLVVTFIKCSSMGFGLFLLLFKNVFLNRLKQTSNVLISVFMGVLTLVLIELLFGYMGRNGDTFGNIKTEEDKKQIERFETINNMGPYIEYSEDVGYKYKNGSTSLQIKKDGKMLYDGQIKLDEFGRREVPLSHNSANKHIIFFGCSATFGSYVSDNETMPYYYAKGDSSVVAYNYAMTGYGPQAMLGKLQSRELENEIKVKQGAAVYHYVGDGHIQWAVGSMYVYNLWGEDMPYYYLDGNKLIRDGSFTTGRFFTSLMYSIFDRSKTFKYFNVDFPVKIKVNHALLTAQIIIESANAYKKQFPGNEFYVLLTPFEGGGRKFNELMLEEFKKAGIKSFDYSDLFSLDESYLIEGDGHPSAKGYQEVGKQLYKDLSEIN